METKTKIKIIPAVDIDWKKYREPNVLPSNYYDYFHGDISEEMLQEINENGLNIHAYNNVIGNSGGNQGERNDLVNNFKYDCLKGRDLPILCDSCEHSDKIKNKCPYYKIDKLKFEELQDIERCPKYQEII